jgi:cytochrome b561
MSVVKFSLLQRVLHWTMSAAIFLMLFIGIGMVSTITPAHLTLLSIHKPLGIAILILVIVRLIVRLTRGTPPLPSDLPPLMKFAAHASHWALYALMIAMPLIGWGMLSAAGDPVVVAGIHLPSILPMDGAMHGVLRQAHTWLALVLFALVLAHLAAALFHALVRRDGVFESMA